MSGVRLPAGSRWERLKRDHPRQQFRCGDEKVDAWLSASAWQHQKKHLSVTKVLCDIDGRITGYYTLATGQVDFDDLPLDMTRRFPRRLLPVAVLAWLGIAIDCQGQGLGRLVLAQALRDCHDASETFPFVAVILDCIDDAAKAFYRRWDFQEIPGHPYRLFLSYRQLEAMTKGG